jgi:transposase
MNFGGPSPSGLADRLHSVFSRAPVHLHLIPVVPPLSTRVAPWSYSKAWYRRRNEIERLFRRLKGFRLIFSRFDKLDVMFMAFLCFALVVEAHS